MSRILFLALFCIAPALAEKNKEDKLKRSSYRYILDNYFSSRSTKTPSYDEDTRIFSLSGGSDFYRINSKRKFKPVSTVFLSFTQDIRELEKLGNLQLRASLATVKLERDTEISFELTPLLTFPEIQTSFPMYFGLGFGLGFYPFYIVQKKPSFSLHSPFLIGFRFFELYSNLGAGAELDLRLNFPLNELQFYLESRLQLHLIFQF